jgi:hypothetical protein
MNVMLTLWRLRRHSCLSSCLFLAALGGLPAVSQTSPPIQCQPLPTPGNSDSSIAAAARAGKSQKTTRAKKVVTDDDIEAMAGPIPRLRMTGPENPDEVIAAIMKFKATHSPEQTENVVRDWYEGYDEILAATIQGNREMSSLRNANTSNGNDLCQESGDYQECQYRRMADSRGLRSDQAEMISNTALMMRIQDSFLKVRMGLEQNNLHYSWFKIRINSVTDTYQ